MGLALHLAEDLSHRPQRPPHEEQLPLHPVDLLDGVRARVLEDAVLQLLEPVSEQLQDGEGLVHDRVDQRVGQEARVVASEQRSRGPDPLANRVPHVARRLLEGQDGPVADEDAHLLRVQDVLAQLELADDDEQPRLEARVLLVGLHLGPLRHVEHVLDGQGVEVVLLGQGPDDAEVAEAVHVDPADRRPVGPVPGDEARQVLHLLGDGLLRRVVDAGDAGGDGLPRDGVQLVGLDARRRAGRRLLEPARQAQAALALRRTLAALPAAVRGLGLRRRLRLDRAAGGVCRDGLSGCAVSPLVGHRRLSSRRGSSGGLPAVSPPAHSRPSAPAPAPRPRPRPRSARGAPGGRPPAAARSAAPPAPSAG